MIEGAASSGVIERLVLSRANYWIGIGLDYSTATVLLILGCASTGEPLPVLAALATGFAVYSFYEYAFHRWLYHALPSVVRRIHDLHHAQPRLLIGGPFFYSLSVSALSWVAARAFVDAGLAAVFAATILGSYAYQSTVHHLLHAPLRGRRTLYRGLRRHHAIHHARGDVNFGLTWTFWDRLFGTRYRPVRRP